MDQQSSTSNKLSKAPVIAAPEAELDECPHMRRNSRPEVTVVSVPAAGKFALTEGWREKWKAHPAALSGVGPTLYDFDEGRTCIERIRFGTRLNPRIIACDSRSEKRAPSVLGTLVDFAGQNGSAKSSLI